MYSVVLMMTLTTGGDIPEIGRRGGGCYGGGGYGGCYGGGGGRRGRRGGGGGGCCGCYGGGGYGGCYGGMGYGGCMGMGYGYGGCYGGMGMMGYGGCYGSMGMMGYGCMGGGMILQGTQGGGGTQPEKIGKPQDGKKETAAPAPATIVVDLPADAQLRIDGEATTSTGNNRVFVSPALNPGREYHYTLKAEVRRDGKPVTVERVITVRAGELTPVALTLPAVGVAQN